MVCCLQQNHTSSFRSLTQCRGSFSPYNPAFATLVSFVVCALLMLFFSFLQIMPAEKKRKYGTNQSLSRKQRCGSSKHVSIVASKASFPCHSDVEHAASVNLMQCTTSVKYNIRIQPCYIKVKEFKSQQKLQELQLKSPVLPGIKA